MDVILIGSDGLREKTQRISHIDESYQERAAAMFGILRVQKGVGLACPQVGIMEQMFVIDIAEDRPRVFINPSVIETSQETCSYEEGCLSIPGVWADVVRPAHVRVQAWNEKGRPFTLDASGLLARVIQHECDHLEGILFIDHLSPQKREQLLNKYEKLRVKKPRKKLV